MESVACALCGADRTTELFRTKDRNWRLPGEFTVVRCAGCGLVYVNPRPTPDEMAGFYTETFSVRPHFFKGTDGLMIQGTPWETVMGRKLAPLLNLKKGGRVLDVGCGDCLLLLYLQKKGWEVFGLEPRRDAVDLARKTFGLDVRPGLLEESDFERGSFDAVTLMHVFEHVHNPGEIARRISELLAPDGIALIDVPNFAGLESRLFGERWVAVDAPRHLYHFTEKTLRAMLENNGLKVIDVLHGSDVSRYRMGYSESLRHLITDIGLKKYPAKATSTAAGVEGGLNSIPMDSVSRKLENGLFGVISAAADAFHAGGRLSALATSK